jgi:hypothetical protein
MNQISLTLGLMGLDQLHLRVLATSSEDLTEKTNAKRGTNSLSFLTFSFPNQWRYSFEANGEREALDSSCESRQCFFCCGIA